MWYVFEISNLSLRLTDICYLGHARLLTVPTTPFTETGGDYDLSKLSSIVVDSRYADSVDHTGQTLIPPKLLQFADTFKDDLESTLGLDLGLTQGAKRRSDTIFVTLKNETGFRDAAGRYTAEAFSIAIDDEGIVISGASPLGCWWATRSIIQAAISGNSSIAKGNGVDAPGWSTRGVMVSYYPTPVS
jgi:hexosaminidase